MTATERLFLHTLQDIRQKLTENTPYSITRASALLRQLLADESPLVHQVNRTYRLKLEFETFDPTIKLPLRPMLHWRDLNASPFPKARKARLTLGGFLKVDCLTFKEHDYTVLDVLKACAHLKGGVHSGSPSTPKEQSMLDMDEVLTIGGLDATLAALKGILMVAIAGLEPLEGAVRRGVGT